MLEFKNVSFSYKEDNYELIRDLSFNVEKEDFISIIGASGCGKSTIFRLINGLEKLDNGTIESNAKCSYMPQRDLLFPWRTILENVNLPAELKNSKKENTLLKAEDILKNVGLLDYKDSYPSMLSGGMRQRVSFARTLVTGAELLMLDEPFSALDFLTRLSMQKWLLDQWVKNKKTILFVTHDVDEAIFLSKKIFVIADKPINEFLEYKIDYGYPRDREMMSDPKIIELKKELISKLKKDGDLL